MHRHVLKLLNPIGRAEMEREIQKTVSKISEDKEIANISGDEPIEIDKEELKKYLGEIINVKRERLTP